MREEFLTTRSGKTFVLFAGLLDEAHQNGLKSIDTEILHILDYIDKQGEIHPKKRIVSKAVVTMEDGRTFSGIGDADPGNVGPSIVPHIIRQSETRAKARALRDAINVSAVALEELSDGEESGTRTGSQATPKTTVATTLIPIEQGRQTRSRDDELTPGGVLVGRANELIDLLRKAGHKREEVAPYIWKASPEAFEKKWAEYQGKEAGS